MLDYSEVLVIEEHANLLQLRDGVSPQLLGVDVVVFWSDDFAHLVDILVREEPRMTCRDAVDQFTVAFAASRKTTQPP